MGFRASLTGSTAAVWAVWLWLAAHRSGDPAVLGRYSAGYAALVAAVLGLALALTACHWGPVFRRLHAARWNALLLGASVVLALVGAELSLRWLDPGGLSYLRESTRYELDKEPDAELVRQHRPGLVETYQGVEVAINELGLRERPVGPKPPGEFRILFVGDSVTFGWGVVAEDAFPRRIEEALSDGGSRRVRSVNAGVGAYNSAQELVLLRRITRRVDPDLVVLTYVNNDISRTTSPDAEAARAPGIANPAAFLSTALKRTWLYRLYWLRFQREDVGRSDAVWTEGGVRSSIDSVRQMAALCRARDVPFVVFFMPSSLRELRTALYGELSEAADDDGFALVDLEPAFRDLDPLELRNSAIDAHWNPRGHAVAARFMAAALARRGLLNGS